MLKFYIKMAEAMYVCINIAVLLTTTEPLKDCFV